MLVNYRVASQLFAHAMQNSRRLMSLLNSINRFVWVVDSRFLPSTRTRLQGQAGGQVQVQVQVQGETQCKHRNDDGGLAVM
jgi:hypothetical protein